MEHVKHCAIVVRRPEDLWEGTRTSLGLAVQNFFVYLIAVDFLVDATGPLQENLDWLEEMECQHISNVIENAKYNFKYFPLEKIAERLKKMDLIIPFGRKD
jgi:hypothetical protein